MQREKNHTYSEDPGKEVDGLKMAYESLWGVRAEMGKEEKRI